MNFVTSPNQVAVSTGSILIVPELGLVIMYYGKFCCPLYRTHSWETTKTHGQTTGKGCPENEGNSRRYVCIDIG